MRQFIHRHLTYANVMATFAVFVALGGSAFAANYVITQSSQIKDGVVTSADVKNGSLTGTDIKDKSLKASDFSGTVFWKLQAACADTADRSDTAVAASMVLIFIVYSPPLRRAFPSF